MKIRQKTMIFLAGLIWLAIGMVLFSLGIYFLLKALQNPHLAQIASKFSITSFLAKYIKEPTERLMLILLFSLLIGYFKGKMALAKSVGRQIRRIETLPNPAHIKYLYSKSYYALIALMMFLGFSMRFLPIALDTRGMIDVIIGSALINGAMLFFRYLSQQAYLKKKQSI